jgi:hypothetical protein
VATFSEKVEEAELASEDVDIFFVAAESKLAGDRPEPGSSPQ